MSEPKGAFSGKGGVIREERSGAELARELAEQREALRAFEGTAFAQTVASLAVVTESLTPQSVERLQRTGKGILTLDEAAITCGYVDRETGEVKREAFRKAIAEVGMRSHRLSSRHVLFLQDELIGDVRLLSA